MLKRLVVLLVAVAVLMSLSVGAALAGKPASDHDGDADSDVATSYTEDNDTNDGGTPNNVADEGDNRHPSGKDRSVEHGRSGNQGKSESDPDDNGRGPDRSNGGGDKPNGSGGVDLADQDGNNGCGNDDDFEDDNEGWCGGKPKAGHEGNQPSNGDHGGGPANEDVSSGPAPLVGGDRFIPGGPLPSSGPRSAGPFSGGPEVLGVHFALESAKQGPSVLSAGATAGQALPVTGADWISMMVLAVALLGMGALMVRKAKGQAA